MSIHDPKAMKIARVYNVHRDKMTKRKITPRIETCIHRIIVPYARGDVE